jgi:hypothetical protein
MERESFEDLEVARVMNENFICLKVDREERPDIDAIYMDAIQYLSGRGGWPLNCIALPDGKPVYGGTYFRRDEWKNMLGKIAQLHREDISKLLEYANQLNEGLLEQNNAGKSTDLELQFDLPKAINNSKKNFDKTWGGNSGSPKFPMPNNLEYLLRFYYISNDEEVKTHLELTLDKIAAGGIYDHVGGGFSRYSVDAVWKVPHFEKMLYDNAQLISLYSLAYRLFIKSRYKEVVYETLDFLEREMHSSSGGYYSAIDADSEGVEGKFYCWKESELENLIGEDFSLFKSFYNISQAGNWENGNNIIYHTYSVSDFVSQSQISENEFKEKMERARKTLLTARENRIRPSTDTKVLCSWNALLLSGFIEAYRAFSDENILKKAENLAQYLFENYANSEGQIFRMIKNNQEKVSGFLDDYSLLATAFIDLYTVTFEEKWINRSLRISEYAITNFYNEVSELFQLSDKTGEQLYKTKIEIIDNVIPSSNSVMANVLYKLSEYFDKENFKTIAEKALNSVISKIETFPAYFSNWGILALSMQESMSEVVFTGADSLNLLKSFNKEFHFSQIAGCYEKSELPLVKNRWVEKKNLIYVCRNKTCKLPVEQVEDALKQLIL